MYSVKIFPGEGRSLKEYPTKHYPKKKTPHKGGASFTAAHPNWRSEPTFTQITEKEIIKECKV